METMMTEPATLSDGAIKFLNDFKQIKGDSIAARKKNYFHVLDEYQSTNPNLEDVENVAANFAANTRLEEMFQIEFLIRFQMSKALLKTLTTTNCHLSKKILSLKWLFHSTVLVQEILPYCSKSTRESVLLKLGLYGNLEQLQEYYYLIKQEYGLDTAKLLLSALPNNKILEEVYNYGVELNDTLHQVVKDPSFLDKYLEALKNKCGNTSRKKNSNKHKRAITYLANHQSTFFMELINKHEIKCELSSRATSVIVRQFKDEIVSDPKKFFKVLNMPIVIKLLQKTPLFPTFFANLFAKRAQDFAIYNIQTWMPDYPLSYCLHSLSKKDKYKLASETYQKLYGVKFYECSDGNKEYLYTLMPHEELKKYISEKYKNISDVYVERIIYLPVSESIPIIKERINKTSDVRTRIDLVAGLAKTCLINDDKEALFEVLEYVLKRHRNDTAQTRNGFLAEIRQSKLEELPEKCWNLIFELISIFRVKNENFYFEAFFRMKYIQKLLLNKLSVRDELSKIFKVSGLISETTFNICQEQPEIEKSFLIEVGRLIPEMHVNCEDLKQYEHVQLVYLLSIVNWNKRHREDCISLKNVPYYIETLISKLCGEDAYMYDTTVFEYLMANKDYIGYFKLYSIIWRNHSHFHKKVEIALLYLLQNEPSIICDRLSDIFKLKVKYVHRFLSACANYTHLDLPNILLKRAINNIETENMSEMLFSIDVLSHFVTPAQYEKYVEKFLPPLNESQIEESTELYAIRKRIAENIKYLRPLPNVLDVFQKYIKGDFLENSISSIRFIIYNLPQNTVYKVLEDIYKGPVSVRKHSLYLSVNTNKLQSINFLKSCGTTETNASIRKSIIKNSLRLFLKNPTDETLELLKTNACVMEKDDNEAYKFFSGRLQFPNKYFARCMELLWNVLQSCTLESMKRSKYSIFNFSYHQFNMLNLGFIEIVLETMLSEETDIELAYFCANILWSSTSKEELTNKADIICKLIKLQIRKQSENVLMSINRLVSEMIIGICKEGIIKSVNIEIYNEFLKRWNENFPRPEFLGELIFLTLTRERLDHQWSPSRLASKLLELYNEMYDRYDSVVIPVFKKPTNKFFETILWLNFGEMFDFLEILLVSSDEPRTKLLVLSLLPYVIFVNSATKEKHMKVLSIIKSCNSEQVQIAFNQYMRVFREIPS